MGEEVKMAYLVTVAPGDSARMETMLGYALAGRALGYETLIFYALDSALITKRSILDKAEPKVKERIIEALKEGVRIAVCSASAKTFNITSADVVPGVEIIGIAAFYDFAEHSKITLTWS